MASTYGTSRVGVMLARGRLGAVQLSGLLYASVTPLVVMAACSTPVKPSTTIPPAAAAPVTSSRLTVVAGKWTGRFRTFEAILGSHHPVYHPHHWLAFLAVTPTRQRHGIGTQLMAHHHRILDEQNTPGYLEAANWTGYDFYRLQGWREHAAPFLIAPDGPPMYPMWRQPHPPRAGQP